ncbi:MAG: MalY/PatB family protein [Anaerolineaceae bacterium]
MNFDQVFDRQNSESVKWLTYPKEVLPLWVADMDFQCPQAVQDALHERVDHGIFGYGVPPADFAEIVIERMRRRYDWNVAEKEINYVPGVVTGFNLGIRAVCQPGDAVIIHTPAYPPFYSGPQNANLVLVENPLIRNADNSYSIDFDLFEKQIIENKVKAFILCNPQNPTGRVFTHDELTKLAEICLRYQVIICADEIHCDIIYEGHKHIPIASLSPEISSITMTFMAPSKTYNIAGLYASVVVTQSPDLNRKLCSTRNGIVGYPDVLAMTAARAAYKYCEDWLEELLKYLQGNRDWLYQALPEKLPGFHMALPEGTFLAWLDCRALGLEENYKDFFLENAKVALNDGVEYGKDGNGFVRLNFGTQKATLIEAVERMSAAYAQAVK